MSERKPAYRELAAVVSQQAAEIERLRHWRSCWLTARV